MSPILLGLLACRQDASGPPTLVASARQGIELSYPDLAFAPDGTLWVSWTEIETASELATVWVARSVDGGASFEPPVAVAEPQRLFLGTVRQPVLAVDSERVAIAVGGGGYLDSSILLYVADAGAEVPTFEGRVIDQARYADGGPGQPGAKILVDQPELAFDAHGQLMVNFKQGSFDESYQLALAREVDDFQVGRLQDGAPGQPCECCPTDWLVLPEGLVLLALRNNDLNLREIWVAGSRDGSVYGNATFQVSTTGWVIPGCPLDGPMLALSGSVLFATWVDASSGDSQQWWSVSHDQGRSWSPSALVHPERTESQTWPTAAAAPDGTIWTSVEEIGHRTLVASTDDLGLTFTEHAADCPEGPLFFAELASGPDLVGLIGVTEQGALWFLSYGEG